MTNKIKFEIGRVDPLTERTPEQKFIIEKTAEALVYHTRTVHGDLPQHRQIAEEIAARDVIGGGHVRRINASTVRVYGNSSAYGAVPREVKAKFNVPLLEAYRRTNSGLREIKFETWDDRVPNRKQFLTFWRNKHNIK